MTSANDSPHTIVVMGDVTVDWNLARRAPPGISWGDWHPKLKARIRYEPGGAALLARVIREAMARTVTGGREWRVVGMEDVQPEGPGDARFSHSYAVWTPCEGGRGDKRLVWRVDPPMGIDKALNEGWLAGEWRDRAQLLSDADTIVLDDADLGFRKHTEAKAWPQTAHRKPWVLLKASRPVADGELWNQLHRHCPERVVAVMPITDLRGTDGVQISRQLSWERTAQDLYAELLNNRHVNSLSDCAHVVVSLGAAGAVLLSGRDSCSLLFDPTLIEGTWESQRRGEMIGSTVCMAAAVACELARNPERPGLERAIRQGVAAGRSLWDEGYGNADEDMNVAFPMAAVASAFEGDGEELERAEVPAPSQVVVGDGNARRWEPVWTILGDKSGAAEAAKVAQHGAEHALKGVPLGRFGKLVTVDRSEIESFQTIGALIDEYSRSTPSKPISIGVFGAPGAGKSFGIEQVAQSVDPERIGRKIEFNLSQLTSLEDLHDALHQVRDVGLRGSIPLVFWDEFDAPFGRDDLGWLRYFLAPMQDGAFRQGQILHPIGSAIFVFAGGTRDRMDRFAEGRDPDKFRSLKGPDFVSRLRGYVNVLGPDPRPDAHDPHYAIRRAILLRSILERSHPTLFDDGELQIDDGVLQAFLHVSAYRHATRSMEAIIATSRLSGESKYLRSSLPPEAQLDMHVDGREFLSLVQRWHEASGAP